MRNVLIVGKWEPDRSLDTWLREHGWAPIYGSSLDQGLGAAELPSTLVGLALFPVVDDWAAMATVRETIQKHPDIKWVGAFDSRQLADVVIKRFISDNLYDYQVYPLHETRVTMALGHAYGMAKIQTDLGKEWGDAFASRWGLVGDSSAMRAASDVVLRSSRSDCPVLICGPTGTGKEIAARAIHGESERSAGPFVAVNCSAIPPSLLQAELFGYARGAFTGAVEDRAGLMEQASGGTLFLDEIGDMPVESQAVLLRAIEEGSVVRLGTVVPIPVDLRFVAATNRDIAEAITAGSFRADLYYRLAVLRVDLPPLRLREGDIERLANHFLGEGIARLGGRSDLALSPDALEALGQYHWPGNVRELRNCLFKAILRCRGNRIRLRDLEFEDPKTHDSNKGVSEQTSLRESRDNVQKRRLESALTRHYSNMTMVAQDLGVSRTTLYRLMAKYRLSRQGQVEQGDSEFQTAS